LKPSNGHFENVSGIDGKEEKGKEKKKRGEKKGQQELRFLECDMKEGETPGLIGEISYLRTTLNTCVLVIKRWGGSPWGKTKKHGGGRQVSQNLINLPSVSRMVRSREEKEEGKKERGIFSPTKIQRPAGKKE